MILINLSSFAQEINNSGTLEDRKELFDYIIEKTKDREAWSPIKNERLNWDPLKAMMGLEDEFVNANTDEKLFYAIKKLSAARKDRHLRVDTVSNGLSLPKINESVAPIRFFPDFSDKNKIFLFVSDFSTDISTYTKNKPSIGDQLVEINGKDISLYLKEVEQYTRHSTYENFIIRAGYDLSSKNYNLPPHFFEEDLNLTLKPKRGKSYKITLPYLKTVDWTYGSSFRNYPGYEKVNSFNYESFELYKPVSSTSKNLILWWYGFRYDLPEAIDSLIEWADRNNTLDHNVIIDAIDSRGGSQGAYALARLTSKPFKTTGGNIKLSDITLDFISIYNKLYLSDKIIMDGSSRETEDDGTWAFEWLNGPVLSGLAAGQIYSNNVPFKCAHLPYYSDWIMQPAEKHFTGKLVAFFGPWGGSHLTQFSSMIIDNQLGYTIGMPDGGFSNTWEWFETLKFPRTNKPVASFMWSIGHTLRPNNEIAEGNPPDIDEYIPVTRDNYLEYKELLMKRAEEHINPKKK